MSDETYTGWDGPGEAPPEPTEADETPEEPQEAERAEAEPGEAEQPEPKEQPRRYAGKYESVEDLERSYTELERKLGQREAEERQRQEQRPQQPAPDQNVLNEILSMPASRLAEDAGPWDEWIAANFPNYNPAEPSDWQEVKTEIRMVIREREREERAAQQAEQQRYQSADQRVTESFATQFPQFAGPHWQAMAGSVLREMVVTREDYERAVSDPEGLAKALGERMTAVLAPAGPQAMGQWNSRQATQRRAAVPPGGVTPAAPATKPFDPDKYRGWNGPRD